MAKWTLRVTLLVAVIAVSFASWPSAEWHRFREMCYWRSNSTLAWNEARGYCQSNFPGSDMVSIHDPELYAFIGEELLDGRLAWLGLRRASDSSPWVWTDGSDYDYENWYGGSPDWYGETCATVNWGDEGEWTGRGCDDRYSFACQTATSGRL